MSADRCRICDRPLGAYKNNNQVYCSDRGCYEIAKGVKDKIRKQRLKLEAIQEGRICKRCYTLVHEPSMRKYCKSCNQQMEEKPMKKPVVKKPKKKCLTCPELIPNNRKYCEPCAYMRKKKLINESAKRKRDAVKSSRVPTKTKNVINPKWLVRGTVSSHNRISAMGA